MKPVYLDYNATTPLAPEVVEEMLPYLKEHFGNPSSGHYYGQITQDAVVMARKRVAALLACSANEIIFTGGGTEANNLAIKGVAYALQKRGNHIITQITEHPAVLNVCRFLETQGFTVTYLPVDQYGMVNTDDVAEAISDKTILITIMHANNETGTLQPVKEIGGLARKNGVLFHTDAAQSVGKVKTHVSDMNADLLTIAAHKLYGPKGVGALYVRSGVDLLPTTHGAGHEGGLRPGTENVAGVVALGKSCLLALEEMDTRINHLTSLRNEFFALLQNYVPEVLLNGHPEKRLPNTLNVSFPGINAPQKLAEIPQIAASTGSACHHGEETMSPVLAAMNQPASRGLGAVRLSLGRETTREDIKLAAELLGKNFSNN
ncbi:cysteine desulfurase family protein [Dethiobacter alkaliphilus]|uniref:cysteine desulfurase family protein n=1 Tax=Dethiobacter alkaliphilus TaxID=427926 RepID=UPI002226A77A|nr:cysteine desulfurase family protein [Dethiobacter alkaliphilus]MCW3491698.1 cysteine desulfurase [Dethiobacter alkaliphilus]